MLFLHLLGRFSYLLDMRGAASWMRKMMMIMVPTQSLRKRIAKVSS